MAHPSRTLDRTVRVGSTTSFGSSSDKILTLSREQEDLFSGSHGNYGYPNFPPIGNCGSSFTHSSRTLFSAASWSGTLRRYGDNNVTYDGSVHASGLAFPAGITGASGDPWGPEAYSKMKPTQPEFSALNSVYELRELPQMLKHNLESNFLKFQGNYFLALQFGWRPLLSDIRAMCSLQQNAQKRLRQLLRDNGKPVRRGINLMDSVESSSVSGSSYSCIAPGFVTQFYSGVPKFTDTTVESDSVWASARFRYWLPPGPRDVVWRRKMLMRLYGLRPSPSVVYNAVPWSWLVDWFTNLGHVIENVEPGVADRLAADYFYVMRKRSRVKTREASGTFYRSPDGSPVSIHVSQVAASVSKTRISGSPFGFDVKQEDLNGTQLAILGALGLSRI